MRWCCCCRARWCHVMAPVLSCWALCMPGAGPAWGQDGPGLWAGPGTWVSSEAAPVDAAARTFRFGTSEATRPDQSGGPSAGTDAARLGRVVGASRSSRGINDDVTGSDGALRGWHSGMLVAEAADRGGVGLAPGEVAGGDVAGGVCGPIAVTVVGDACFEVGDEISLQIVFSNAGIPIAGGQFFLIYNTAVFDFVTIFPSPPFIQLFQSVDEDAGLIDYAAGAIMGCPPNVAEAPMATLVLSVISDVGTPVVAFREHAPPTRLTDCTGSEAPIELQNAGQAGDIDLHDVAGFQRCFSGANVLAAPDCGCLYDGDGDMDVDLVDYAVFQASVTGPSLWLCGGG